MKPRRMSDRGAAQAFPQRRTVDPDLAAFRRELHRAPVIDFTHPVKRGPFPVDQLARHAARGGRVMLANGQAVTLLGVDGDACTVRQDAAAQPFQIGAQFVAAMGGAG